MAKEESSSASGGIGFFGMLTILFIGLKLANIINWPWVWVLSPLWVPACIGIAVIIIIVIVAIVVKLRK